MAAESRQNLYNESKNMMNFDVKDILDALPFYVLLVDEDHTVISANEAIHSQLGVKREDLIGGYCPKVVHGTDSPFPGCPLEESAEKNMAIEREIYDQVSRHWVMSAIYPTRVLTPAGKRVFLHVVIDITERKQAQEQLRISHDQLRSLSAHLESVREEEKRVIARDLHDETSQLLASLSAHLEAATRSLPDGSERTRSLLKTAQTISTTILDEIHKLIYELRPSVLDKLGLIAAINSLIDNYLSVLGIKVKFKTSGKERRLLPSSEIVLFRIIQEGFNNIAKHARAKKVQVNMHFGKKSIKIRIQDDGVGFNVADTLEMKDRSHGWGLIGMRERVELVNGSLIINSKPDVGTELVIEVPFAAGDGNG
jgi:PAS domain S-box-containing protein